MFYFESCDWCTCFDDDSIFCYHDSSFIFSCFKFYKALKRKKIMVDFESICILHVYMPDNVIINETFYFLLNFWLCIQRTSRKEFTARGQVNLVSS